MSFLANPWLWGLFGLLPVIVIMYLLKLKRRRVLVPSTLLWRRSVQDMIANSPFQKMRNNLLMWLQLLLLALLILAFLRPVMKLENLRGTRLILLIDISASMQTEEEDGRTRLEIAQDAALDAIASLKSEDEVAIYTFSNRVQPIQTLTSDLDIARTAVRGIAAQDTHTTLAEAGLLLQGLTATRGPDGVFQPLENAKTVILSDGAIAGTDSLADVPNVEFVRIGTTTDNMGITAVDVRESFAGDFEYQIFVSVTNSSAEEKEAYIELQADGEVLDLKAAAVPPGGTSGVVFSTGEILDGIATIRLDGEDALSLDNTARVRIQPPTDISILVVSNGNFFIEQALSVDPRVKVSRISPAGYTPSEEYDIVIFDNATSGELPPGNFVFINSLPPLETFAEGAENVSNPRIIDWNRVHPLTRYVNFEDVLIGQAMDIAAPRAALPILQAVETDLITLTETETQKFLVIGFDVFKSYWPVDVSFPIFIANMIDYFSRSGSGILRPSYSTGETIALIPGREDTKVTVTTPAGETLDFPLEGISTAYLTETSRAGIYSASYDSRAVVDLLPVNMLSFDETIIAPRESLVVGGSEIIGSDEKVRTDQEVWHWFVLAALGILMVEWAIYCRRTFM
ncbi:MAG: BatA and WFA domain-containing protein [Sumerlaeia bacterium]